MWRWNENTGCLNEVFIWAEAAALDPPVLNTPKNNFIKIIGKADRGC